MLFGGMTESDLAKYGDGVIAVLIASIMVYSGCGPQIIAISAYVKDIISFPALTNVMQLVKMAMHYFLY